MGQNMAEYVQYRLLPFFYGLRWNSYISSVSTRLWSSFGYLDDLLIAAHGSLVLATQNIEEDVPSYRHWCHRLFNWSVSRYLWFPKLGWWFWPMCIATWIWCFRRLSNWRRPKCCPMGWSALDRFRILGLHHYHPHWIFWLSFPQEYSSRGWICCWYHCGRSHWIFGPVHNW